MEPGYGPIARLLRKLNQRGRGPSHPWLTFRGTVVHGWSNSALFFPPPSAGANAVLGSFGIDMSRRDFVSINFHVSSATFG